MQGYSYCEWGKRAVHIKDGNSQNGVGWSMNKLLELLFFKQLKGIGNVAINKRYAHLIEKTKTLEECIKLVEENETKISLSDIEAAKKIAEQKYKNLIDTLDLNIITIFDDDYPLGLNDLKDKRPVVLYIKGDKEVLRKKSIAVVGTRQPSKWSEKVEKQLVKKITQLSDVAIVSGLALGCDRIAHQATIDSKAKTIAVLPSGVNIITPARHKKLAKDIIETGGCLISEYDPNAKANKSTYVERDAVVAALASATFVVECGINSGTMHTVNAADTIKRKLACYYFDDASKGKYDGNAYMLQNKGASKVSDTNELEIFLKSLDEEKKDPEPKQLSLFDDDFKVSE